MDKKPGLRESSNEYVRLHFRIYGYIWPSIVIFFGGAILLAIKFPNLLGSDLNRNPALALLLIFAIVINFIYYKWRRKKET